MLLRYVRGAGFRGVRPTRVVSDGPDGTALWLAAGTPTRVPASLDGVLVRDLPLEQRYTRRITTVPGTWTGTSALIVFRPDAWSTVHRFFDAATGVFAAWYGNVETPPRRWDDGGVAGFDTDDLELDVVREVGRAPRLKDADEAAAAVRTGDVDPRVAARAEAEAAALLVAAATGAPPFDDAGTDFRPPAAWTVPTLPPGWDRPVVPPAAPGYVPGPLHRAATVSGGTTAA